MKQQKLFDNLKKDINHRTEICTHKSMFIVTPKTFKIQITKGEKTVLLNDKEIALTALEIKIAQPDCNLDKMVSSLNSTSRLKAAGFSVG